MAFVLAAAATSLAGGTSAHAADEGFWDIPQGDSLDCGIEPLHHYASTWNVTSLTVCRGRVRPEQVCIVGGGMSGLHMGWLLKRRGFEKTVVLEANDRVGGKVYTLTGGVDGGDVTREIGAAFLSPDYVEVRALIDRFGQSEVPLSVKHMMRFHWNGTVGPSSEWYGAQVASITNTTDPTANAATVSAALTRYFAIHASIFGNYTSRFPPKPAALMQIAGTADDFIARNRLAVLRPLFYQFFVLQGMGLLSTMPAYYMLKWVSPASLRAGGFGNDMDTPLAMLKDGFGAVAAALVKDVDLEVKLGARVTSITRSDSVATVLYRQPGTSSTTRIACDLLVLSGPIPKYVRGSTDGTVPPILTPPTPNERAVFGTMRPMQFLVSLVEFGTAPAPSPPPFEQYEALEYWPQNYPSRDCGVIVRRNIKSAETGAVGGAIGGVQSYSYWPAPVCNESMHWASQQRWAAAQGLSIEKLYKQYYSDTYLYHYNTSEVEVEGKPWAVHDIQFENRTLYVGGAAGYETVEDSLQFNLELVDRFFRSSGPVPLAEQSALEQLVFELDCGDVDRFIKADNATWTQYLLSAPGFHSKQVTVNPGAIGTSCEIWSQIWWSSREKWKSLPASALSAVQQKFVQAFGSDPVYRAFPSGDGLSIVSDHLPSTGPVDSGHARARLRGAGYDEQSEDFEQSGQPEAIEVNYYNVSCGRVGEFIRVDNATWNLFLSAQPGFRQKLTLLPDMDSPTAAGLRGHEENCTVWTMTRWETRTLWHAVPLDGVQKTAAKFAAIFGHDVKVNRFPTAAGLTVIRDTPAAGFPPKVRLPAIAGNDVVAYFSLKTGEPDVPGFPTFKRFIDPTPLLPKTLLAIHPEPYEFWFSSNANAMLFDADPWRYIPQFGGHCTHGIASRNDLTPPLLVDGRVAFTCVNTTKWAVVNGSLYMNSCGMYADFMKDPAGDIIKARSLWAEWFGERASGAIGPINDACFQNGGLWDGPPDWVGQLIPPRCVIN